jgi:hypothetical protein
MEIAKSQNRDLEFLKNSQSSKLKIVASNREPIALQRAALFFIAIGDKAAKLVHHLSRLSDAQAQTVHS